MPNWKECIKVVGFNTFDSSNFIYVASSMYARKYFDSESKNEVAEIANNIRWAFEVIIQDIDWMSKKVKERAMKKLFMMQQYIGFMDEYLDKEKIDGLHQGIEVTTEKFFDNVINLYKFWRASDYRKLRIKIDPTSWKEHYLIAIVNAFYYLTNNYMVFPAGFLQVS